MVDFQVAAGTRDEMGEPQALVCELQGLLMDLVKLGPIVGQGANVSAPKAAQPESWRCEVRDARCERQEDRQKRSSWEGDARREGKRIRSHLSPNYLVNYPFPYLYSLHRRTESILGARSRVSFQLSYRPQALTKGVVRDNEVFCYSLR